MRGGQSGLEVSAVRRDRSEMEAIDQNMSAHELELLREILRSLRSLRYGSLNLTVHDGRLVEIQKVEKIRMNSTKAKE